MHGLDREQALVHQGRRQQRSQSTTDAIVMADACSRRQQRWQSARDAIVMADARSSAMEAIGAASPLSKQAVVAIVIAGACS